MSAQASSGQAPAPEVRRRIVRWIVEAALGWLGYGALLFVAAGRLDWGWGWALLGVLAAFLAAHPLLLVPINPELLAEREKGIREAGTRRWDRRLTLLGGGLLPIASWLVAALDRRWGWTGPLPPGWHVAGLLLTLLGYALFLWAMTANAFFAEGVRIQEERGHRPATGGPYRAVRHPGYAGAILSFVSTPLLLGSPWALLPAAGAAALYVVRTWLEDRTLIDELPGYREYAQQTRYRLVPRIW